MPRSIAVVTSSRADYSHLFWPMKEMLGREGLDPQLWITGAHLSPEFGRTVEEIESDGLPIAERVECLLSADSDLAMAKTLGLATISFGELLARRRPDLVMVLADRYEMLAPASAAMTLRIPLVHTEGGEWSEGAIDQSVRNALTAMSHVHLVTTEAARERVIQMGEQSWRVHRVGAPSLDHLVRDELPSRNALEAELGFEVDPATLVVGYHPVTLDRNTTAEAEAVYGALEQRREPMVFCFPNADAGSRELIQRARDFCGRHALARVVVNLAPPYYWSLLKHGGLLYGNSSSGVMESTSVGVPAIDIGRRQGGRERADNVIHADADVASLVAALEQGATQAFRNRALEAASPYGDGHAGERIAQILDQLPGTQTLLAKTR